MPKSDLTFPDGYSPVAERIALFYERYPSGRIIPRLHSITDDDVIFEARVYRYASDTEPAAVGWARELQGDGDINTVACVENTETSAIGRALANLGFTASRLRPSAEEMAKAARARARIGAVGSYQEPAHARRVSESAILPIDADPLQQTANEITDTLGLLATAEAYGMRPARVERFRERVTSGCVAAATLHRIRQLLRDWLAKQRRQRREKDDPSAS